MKAILKAGACALAMAAAVPASATTYATFTMLGFADGDIQTYNPRLFGYKYDVQLVTHGFFRATFDVRLDYASGTGAPCASFVPFCGVSASGNKLTFGFNAEGTVLHRGAEDFNFVLCLTGPASIPFSTTVFSVDPSCSSVSFFQGYTDIGSSRGTVTSLSYADIRVYESASTPRTGFFGLDSGVAFTPEPATWATMLLGFAMSGYALRRRRAALAHP